MVCERCNKKKATVFYRENIGGRIKALRLCGECAEILEQAGELEEISAAVVGFVSPLILLDEGILPLPFPPLSTAESAQGITTRRMCPVCGAKAEEIGQAGRVGCAACYEIFGREITPVIHSAHGKSEHIGRISAGYRARKEKVERLAGLKKQLKEAVANEQYESAAGLRDEIRALEAEL